MKDIDKHWADVKAGLKKALCRVGTKYHGVEVGEDCEVCTAEVIDLMTHHPDKGPWVVSKDCRSIQSDDFRHDVQLVVTGDFFNEDVRKKYVDHLADILNKAITPKEPSAFDPRDTKQIQEWYTHPKYANEEGQGYYVMIDIYLKAYICSSGNELKRVHQLDPSKWLTGPMWLPMSKEDYTRIWAREEYLMDNL